MRYIVILLVVFGLKAYPALGIDLYPDVDFPVVTVNVTYTGASPEEMESLIIKHIEDAVSSLAGIKTLSSISCEGSSIIVVEFDLGTNSKQATQDVREKVACVKRRLPTQADYAIVQRYDMIAQAVLSFSLVSDTRNSEGIFKLAQDTVSCRKLMVWLMLECMAGGPRARYKYWLILRSLRPIMYLCNKFWLQSTARMSILQAVILPVKIMSLRFV